MYVKVGDKWYDSRDVPIVLGMARGSIQNLIGLDEDLNIYAEFPDNWGDNNRMYKFAEEASHEIESLERTRKLNQHPEVQKWRGNRS